MFTAEVGDYDEQDHPPGYVSEFKMLPKQNAKMEEEIAKLHKIVEQGAGLSLGQDNTVHKLVRAQEELQKENEYKKT